MSKKMIGFQPVMSTNTFEGFWAVENAWGKVRIEEREIVLTVLYGTLQLNAYLLSGEADITAVLADGNAVSFTQNGEQVQFENTVTIHSTFMIR